MSTKDPSTLDYKERRRRELSGEGTGRKRREAKENKQKIPHDSKTQNGTIPTETPKDRVTRRRRQKDASTNGVVVKTSNESNHKPTKNDKINIVETTPHLLTENNSEKENKQKSSTNQTNSRNSLRKATGSKILDKLSRFESGDVSSKKTNGSLDTGHGNKSSFQRHYTGAFRAATNTEPVGFRRSYRLPRTSAIEDTGSHVRRSLRGRATTKSVKDSIAKLEGKDSTKTAPSTKPSLAASRTRIIRDTSGTDGSKISDIQRRLERAEHALEKHKDRLRKTPVKGGKSKTTGTDKDTPTKTNIRKKLDSADKNKTPHEPKKTSHNTPSVSKETTLVAEVTSPSQEKVSLVIKERNVPQKPEPEPVSTSEEPKQRNLSVGQGVELFSTEAPETPKETNENEASADKHVDKSRRRSRKSIPNEITRSPTKEAQPDLHTKKDKEVQKVKEETKTVEKNLLAKEGTVQDSTNEEAKKLDAAKESEDRNAVFEETSVVAEVTLLSKEEVSLIIKERSVPKEPEAEQEAVTEASEEPKQRNLSVGKAVELFSVAESVEKTIETETKKTESSETPGRRSRRRSRKSNSDLSREEGNKSPTKHPSATNEEETVSPNIPTYEASSMIVKEASKEEEKSIETKIEVFEEPKKSPTEPQQESMSTGKTPETLPTEAVVSDKPFHTEANEQTSEEKPNRKSRRRSRKSFDLSRDETPKSPTKVPLDSPAKEVLILPSKQFPESPPKDLSISMKVMSESPTSPSVKSPTIDIPKHPTEDLHLSPVKDTPPSPLKEVASTPTVQEKVKERKPSIKEMAKAMDEISKAQEDSHLTKNTERKTSVEAETNIDLSDKFPRKTRRRSRKSSSDIPREEKSKSTAEPKSPTKKLATKVEDTTSVFKDTPAVKPSSKLPSVASSIEPKTKRKSRHKSSEPKAKEMEKPAEIIIIEKEEAKISEMSSEVPPEELDDAIQTLQRLSLEVETGGLQDLVPSASKSKEPEKSKTFVVETTKPEAVTPLPEAESFAEAPPEPQKVEPAKPTTPEPIPVPKLTKRQLLRKRILTNRARMVLKPPIVVVSDDDDDLLLSDASTDELDSDDSWLDHESDDEKKVSNGMKAASPVKSKFLEADRKVQLPTPAKTTPQKLKPKVEESKNHVEKKSPTKRTPSPSKPKVVETEKKIAKKTVVSDSDEEDMPKPKVNAMLSMWEDKAAASKKVETSSPARSPMNIRKLRETGRDTAFVSDSDDEKVQDRSRIKSTLSDMVECDECDIIINVKNVKAMWESQFSNTSETDELNQTETTSSPSTEDKTVKEEEEEDMNVFHDKRSSAEGTPQHANGVKSAPRKRELSISSSESDVTLSSQSDDDDGRPLSATGSVTSTVSSLSSSSSGQVSMSLKERLRAIEKKEQDAKIKQPKKVQVTGSLGDRMKKLTQHQEKWKDSSKPEKPSEKNVVGKLTERVASIKRDSETWKAKTGKQNDSAQFSVKAKIAKREGLGLIKVMSSPKVSRKTPLQILPKDVVTENEVTFKHKSESMSKLSMVEMLASKGLEENVIKTSETNTTIVPQIDNEQFESFFSSGVETKMFEINGDVESSVDDGFDLPEIGNDNKLTDLGKLRASVRPSSRKRKGSRKNPLRALAARENIKDSYDEERTNVARLEQQRIASRGFGANFTSAALAGLAAKADLSKVRLKSAKHTPMPSSDDLRPFKDVTLLRVKGRKRVQTRLVEPVVASLCSDDAFLLVRGNDVYAWFGEFCNVIERAKVNEMADYIVRKGDLGAKANSYTKIEESSKPKTHKEFWDILGGFGEWQTEVSPDADQHFETVAETSIKCYKMQNSKLEPYDDAWGKLPKMEMLTPNDIFVFDFGSEMYIWQGKEVSFADRRLAVRLARVLWEQDYDYTDLGISPFHCKELKAPRPTWGLFARVNENLETCAVQEKFENWSNIHREVGDREAELRETSRGAAVTDSKVKAEIRADMMALNASEFPEECSTPQSLLLSGYNLWQGESQVKDEDGRIMDVVTVDTQTYHMDDKDAVETDDCVLRRGDTYIVRWRYLISSTGKFETRQDKKSINKETNGRNRVCYFVWVGKDSSINDKGASALIASNMNLGGEEGPHIVVNESCPPPAFSRTFGGCCMVMDGKSGGKNTPWEWKLFTVRGNSKSNTTLTQIKAECSSLRSRSSFIMLQARKGYVIVWHGCQSPEHTRNLAQSAADILKERKPPSLGFRSNEVEITVCEEDKEPELFWDGIGLKRRTKYLSLLEEERTDSYSLNAFRFSVRNNCFSAVKMAPVETQSSFPFVQDQLYDLEQPALVLMHSSSSPVYLWQGWQEADASSSLKRLWEVTRRLGMESALNYCKENYIKEQPLMVYAGHEFMEFINLFPSWTARTDINKVESKVVRKQRTVEEALSTLSRLTYTIEELRSENLPDGVDPRHLETYLSSSDFETLFKMSREEFYKLPSWKQTKIRQTNNFF